MYRKGSKGGGHVKPTLSVNLVQERQVDSWKGTDTCQRKPFKTCKPEELNRMLIPKRKR